MQLFNVLTKYYYVTMPTIGLVMGLLTNSASAQDLSGPLPSPADISTISNAIEVGGWPVAMVISAMILSWFASKIVDQLKSGGIPVSVEVGFDQRSRKLLREIAHVPHKDDPEEL